MRTLFIGGTGTISLEITRLLSSMGEELYLLNRGNNAELVPKNVKTIKADINDEESVKKILSGMTFDVVVDFIAFVKPQLERDYRLFKDITKQFIFISTASAYQKPPVSFPITESTPVANPFWKYSRDKIECENYLMDLFRSSGFPVTIVRPSHTYGDQSNVLGGWNVFSRIQRELEVIIPGDGTTLWTLTHSRDFAKAFAGLLGNPHAIGDTFHITSDEALTWNQIYQIHADALGVPLRPFHIATDFLSALSKDDYEGSYKGDKSNNGVFDNSKIKRVVPGFVATTRFDKGVLPIAEYFLANKELQKPDNAFDKWCDAVIAAQREVLEKLRKLQG